jgi:hypothetical protein
MHKQKARKSLRPRAVKTSEATRARVSEAPRAPREPEASERAPRHSEAPAGPQRASSLPPRFDAAPVVARISDAPLPRMSDAPRGADAAVATRVSGASMPPVDLDARAATRISYMPEAHARTSTAPASDAEQQGYRWSSPPRPSGPPAASSAIAGGDEHEVIAHDFFSVPPPAAMIDAWDDDAPVVLNRGAQRARLATLVILGVSVCSIGIFTAYNALVMPEAVELGSSTVSDLPAILAPVAVAPSAPVAPSVAEPAARPQPVAAPTPVAAAEPAPSAVPAANVGPSYEDLMDVGRTLGNGGRRKDAIEAYQRALALRPDAAEPLARLANFELNAGNAAAAKSYAARAVISDPTNAEGWIVLGAAHQALGDHAASAIAYRKCAALGVGAYATECQQLAR